MARKKKEEAPQGAPEWMVTYGDMVTLLLTFFVLLVAMSEVKKDQRMIEFMQAVKEAFGYVGGTMHLPTEEIEIPRNIDEMTALITTILPENLGHTREEGPSGKHPTTETIREGDHYKPGGRFYFPELSAELGEREKKTIGEYAEKLRGHTTILQVWGHCSKRPVEGTHFEDHMDLSIQRARAVAAELIKHGIDPRRIQIIGAGVNRPVTRSAGDPTERAKNDVVELQKLDQTIEEFEP